MKRDLYWDSLKFILIFLVVYGHAVEQDMSSHFNIATHNFIYLFHMPLFIFISGRFSQMSNKERFRNGMWRLLETYIVFQTIQNFMSIILGEEFSWKDIVCPKWTRWYLVALVYWRLLVYFASDILAKYKKLTIIVSICISLFAGFIPISGPVVQRTFGFLPFFIIGYYSKDWDVKYYIQKCSFVFAAIVLVLAFFVILYWGNDKGYGFVTCNHTYWAEDILHTMKRFIGRCVLLPVATILSVMLMRLVPMNNVLAKYGSISLFIYIYHSIILSVLKRVIARGILPQNEVLLLIYAVAITLGLAFLSRFKLFNVLLNPMTYVKGKIHRS